MIGNPAEVAIVRYSHEQSHPELLPDEYRMREEYLEALYAITLGLLKQPDRSELLVSIIERAAALTGMSNGLIATLDPGGEYMTSGAALGLNSNIPQLHIRHGEGLIGQVWKEDRIIAIDNYSSWPQRVTEPGLDRCRAVIGAPFHSGGRVVGVFALMSRALRKRFEEEQLRLLERFARLVSLAVENSVISLPLRDGLVAGKINDKKFRQFAYYHSGTGMPNRSYFVEKVSEMLKDKERMVAVIALDLDRFSIVNDIAGYEIGDELLSEIVNAVTSLIREDDIIANVWGDKFLLAIPGTTAALKVDSLADRILNMIRQPWRINGQEFFMSASMGISIFPDDGTIACALVRCADMAAAQAKDLGGNNYQYYTERLSVRVRKSHDMGQHLRNALRNDEFRLVYQPRIDMATYEISGMEALLRWNNEKLGDVSPADFIPVAESNGLIIRISEWVIRKTCMQMQEWIRNGVTATVSVNLSPQQFYQKDLLSFIRDALSSCMIPPSMLELEVTETVAIKDIERAVALLRALKDMGVRLAMDDFGTGYSSLTSLRRLPLDTLKIDKAFVHDAENSPESRAIVQTIVSLGHALNLKVTAEGIETLQQLSLLQRLGCDEAQGFFFSRPVSSDDMSQMLISGNKEAMKMKERRTYDSSSL
jgi:diguanylate cyclase (GGDEF)-like protein